MVFKTSSERMADAMQKAQRHWEQRRRSEHIDTAAKAETPPPLIVAISREAGARGTTIAHAVGAKLGWSVYDRELLEKIAEDKGLRVQLLESLDEKHISWLREIVEGFSLSKTITEEAYVHYLVETVHALAALGGCVIVGRGAVQFLPEEKTFRVRLVGNKPDRIANIQQRFNITADEAARRVEKIDRERTRFVQEHFNKDPADPCHYDLIVNTSRFAVEAATTVIVEGLHQLQQQISVHPGSGTTR